MPIKDYSTNYKWISQDNFVVSAWEYLEWKNVDGISDGYVLKLWPKVNKQLLTTLPIKWILSRTTVTGLVWGWDIYYPTSTDLTPEKTLVVWDTIYYLVDTWVNFNSFYYLLWHNSWGTSWAIHKISDWDFEWWVRGWFTFALWGTTFSNSSIPPIVIYNRKMYFWWNSKIIESDWTTNTVKFLSTWDVVGFAINGTMLAMYTSKWLVEFWDGASAAVSSQQKLWFIPKRVVQDGNITYITSEDGRFYRWSWYTFVEISNPKASNRLEDNSWYTSKLDFTPSDDDNRTLTVIWDQVYLASPDDVPWIYRWWDLYPWLPKWFHKVISQDNDFTDLSKVYTLKYIDSNKRLYFSYYDGTNYWVDYTDLSSQNTSKDWFMVTEVLRWPPNKMNQIVEIRTTTLNTSSNNYIKLYKRIDNWSWVLFKTYNEVTDTILRDKISTESDEFVDMQFKIEFHNDDQDSTGPELQALELNYKIIQD